MIEVEQCPTEHYNVVNVEDEADGDSANANAAEQRRYLLPNGNATAAVVLTDAHLKEEDRNGAEDEEDEVWYKEGPCLKAKNIFLNILFLNFIKVNKHECMRSIYYA